MIRLHSIIALGLLAVGLSACAGTAQPAIEPTASAKPTAAPQRSSSIKLADCTIGNVTAQS